MSSVGEEINFLKAKDRKQLWELGTILATILHYGNWGLIALWELGTVLATAMLDSSE